MSSKSAAFKEPILGEGEREHRQPTAIGKVGLTPRSQLGAAKIHTRSRKTSPQNDHDWKAAYQELEVKYNNLVEQARKDADQRKKERRQIEAIHVRVNDLLEGMA